MSKFFNTINGLLNNKFTHNTAYLLSEKVIRLVGSFLVFSQIAKYLGPNNFGIYNYSIALFTILMAIVNFGLHGILVKHLCVEDEAKYKSYLGSAFLIKFLLGLIFLFTLFIVYPFIFESILRGELTVIICFGLLFQSFTVIECWFEAKVDNKLVSLTKSSFFVLYVIIVTIAVYFKVSLVSLCYLFVIEIVLRSLALTIAYQKSGERIFDYKVDKRIVFALLRDGFPLVMSSVAAIIYLKIDQIMIGEMLNDTELGYYSGAVRISEAIYFVPWIIANSVFPLIVENKKHGWKRHVSEFRKLSGYFLIISFLVSLVLFSASYYLVLLVLGVEYLDSVLVLKIHIWSIVFVSLRALVNKWFIVEGMYKKLFLLELIGALINIILNFCLIPILGIIGAAIATLISYSLISYFGLLIFKDSRKVFYIFSTSIKLPIDLLIKRFKK